MNARTTPDRAAGSGRWLVGDVGGTNARFGRVDPGAPDVVADVRSLPVRDHAGPLEAIRAYLRETGQEPPSAVGLALATAIDGDEARLTNSPWVVRASALARSLGVSRVVLLNDFEALALALPLLGPSQRRAHGPAPRPHGVLAVVGPGTGLGVGAVVPTPSGWQALPGEGGHATLAPADDVEGDILAWVRRRHAHVSAERLLSGVGLPLLHEAVAVVRGRVVAPVSTPELVDAALRGDDDASATIDRFCAMLGGVCGNVALTVGARSGLYVAGGIVPRLGDRFFRSAFRERFEAKGRFRDYLAAVPTAVVTDTLAALAGVAAALSRPPGR